MTVLTRLSVSLTKHGAHKVSDLLRGFPADEVLDHVWGSYRDIHIDKAQAAKTLAADEQGNVPAFWDQVRQLGDDEIDNLTFLAILFSHHKLIAAFQQAQTDRMQGRLVRGQQLDGKDYTNTVDNIRSLGFETASAYEFVAFDLRRLFVNPNLVPLVAELLQAKLVAAGWDRSGSLIDEAVRHGFHEALALTEGEFRAWLQGTPPDPYATPDRDDTEDAETVQFEFRSGHTPRQEGEVSVEGQRRSTTIDLIHNQMQNKLYDLLAAQHGRDAVGTENPSPSGSVDLVLNEADSLSFYEIKTATSLKTCIRQALPQLLEYAYWPDQGRADTLVIVSPNQPSESAVRYLQHLRDSFGLPIYYQQLDMESGELGQRI